DPHGAVIAFGADFALLGGLFAALQAHDRELVHDLDRSIAQRLEITGRVGAFADETEGDDVPRRILHEGVAVFAKPLFAAVGARRVREKRRPEEAARMTALRDGIDLRLEAANADVIVFRRVVAQPIADALAAIEPEEPGRRDEVRRQLFARFETE